MCCDDIKFALKSVVAVHPLIPRRTRHRCGHCGSSTTMKDLLPQDLLSPCSCTNTFGAHCLTLKSMGKGEEVYLLAIAQSFLFTWLLRGLPATYY